MKNAMPHPKHIEVEEAGGGGRYFEVRVGERQLVSGREAVDLVEPHAGDEVGHGGVRAEDERTFRNVWRGEGTGRLSEQPWPTRGPECVTGLTAGESLVGVVGIKGFEAVRFVGLKLSVDL